MIYLRFGDRLPSVAIIQRLINECRQTDSRCSGIEALVEDGIYGPRTFAAVKAVQRALSVRPDNGVFDPSTWRALGGLRRCKIVDVTDLAFEAVYQREGEVAIRQRFIREYQQRFPNRTRSQAEFAVDRSIRKHQAEIRACRSQHERFVANGGDPIGLTDVEDTFDAIRRGIEARSRDGSRIVLLRFTGHGSPASQGVAGSLVGAASIVPDMFDFHEDHSPRQIVETVVLGGMTMPMASFGCVELHGCNVAAYRQVGRGPNRVLRNGPAYVQNFANLIGRPVTGATTGDSYGTLMRDTRYEGPVVTCVPGGGDVRDWFRQH